MFFKILLMVLLSPVILLLILLFFLFNLGSYLYERARGELRGSVSAKDFLENAEIDRYYVIKDKGEIIYLGPKKYLEMGSQEFLELTFWVFVSEDGYPILLDCDNYRILDDGQIMIRGFWRFPTFCRFYLEVC